MYAIKNHGNCSPSFPAWALFSEGDVSIKNNDADVISQQVLSFTSPVRERSGRPETVYNVHVRF
jgi:hypothetical protein